jgi:hypothetical protein
MFNHEPVDYRSPGQDRFETPAEVCGTCSDFDSGTLVPVSFCPAAMAKSEEIEAWRRKQGPRPEWLDMPDAARWTPELTSA